MQFGILGPLLIRVGREHRRVPPGRQRALLALLVVQAQQTVTADRLIEALWGEALPGNPANALQGRISQLRKTLREPDGEQVLVQQGAGYCLDVPLETIDAYRFERLARAAHELLASNDPAGAADTLRDALGLWRGAALEDVADEPWALTEAQRLNELRLGAVEDRVEADLALGRHSALVAELEELVAANPLREGLRKQVMVALYRSGRQADALSAYHEGRDLLADELGIDPSPALRELEKRILCQDPALDWQPTVPASPPEPVGTTEPAGEESIGVFLVDDHAVVRRGMAAFLDQIDDLRVVGEASDGDEALETLGDLELTDALPDVVLMDVLMPRMDGITATAEITRRHPGVQVVAVTSFTEVDKVHGALAAGAAGYLLKHAEADEVAMAIRAARCGDVHLDSMVAAQLARSLQTRQTARPLLTRRETDVLKLVAEGASNKRIARDLFISERTARNHISSILGKLGVESRTQAALWAVHEGLVAQPSTRTPA